MKDYTVSHTNTDAVAFPNTGAINATGPSATDGTEYIKAGIDDTWGARQAIMDRAGLSPDGVTEAAGTAQIIEAMNLMAGAPGTGEEWLLADDPGTTGHRALLRQGQGILLASYPDLINVYVGDANNAAVAAGGGAFYRADNANGTSPNIAGIYLILDETRGVVPRGLDLAASIDPDGAGRFLGDLQIDAFQGHLFYNGIADDGGSQFVYGPTANEVPGAATNIFTAFASAPTTQGLTSTPKTDGVNGTPRTSSESRGANRATVWILWY